MQLDATDAAAFALAGNAYMTLRSAKTGSRYTYRIAKADDDDRWFVSTLAGPNNEADYVYIGMIGDDRRFRRTKASKMGDDALPVSAFRFFCEQTIASGRMPQSLEVYHEGRCGRCARKLTVPESIESGFGPECAKLAA